MVLMGVVLMGVVLMGVILEGVVQVGVVPVDTWQDGDDRERGYMPICGGGCGPRS